MGELIGLLIALSSNILWLAFHPFSEFFESIFLTRQKSTAGIVVLQVLIMNHFQQKQKEFKCTYE